MTVADQAARDRIETDLDATLIVEAAAGTGKTEALVRRIVAVVSSGATTLDRIIAVTFTEKAAGEMKLRLRDKLEQARKDAKTRDEHANLERALEQLEVARIGTIHALCADLLREHPVEAGVDPLFEVCKEPEAQALLDAAFDAWLPRMLKGPPEGVRRLLRRRSRRRDAVPPREQLRRAAWQLAGHRDFNAPWAKDPSFVRDAELDALIPQLRETAALAKLGEKDDWLQKNLAELQRFVDDLDHRERGAKVARDHDGLEAALAALARQRSWTHKGYGQLYGTLQRAEVLAKRDALKTGLDRALERAEADLAACLHEDLWPLVRDYEAEKERTGKLDFFDLLLKLNDLLEKNTPVRRKLQERFTHLFVDEFQDTDPLQADILRLLAAHDGAVTDPEAATPVPGKLFLVGDPKQSIYRFRRADVALYESIKQKLKAQGAEVLDLTTSFRGEPELQQAINTAFAPVMTQVGPGPHTQARYVPLTRFRPEIAGQPELVVLPVPRPYAEFGRVTNQAIDASFPGAVAAWVEWLVKTSGWKVVETGGKDKDPVPVQPRHICVLFRRFRRWEGDDVTIPYTRALEARGIPHVLVGGRSFHGREEVLALRNALAAIEWPDDELSVYATLKGPLFALSDDALLVFRHLKGRLHPLKPLLRAELPAAAQEVADALALLGRLHRDREAKTSRNRRPIGDTIAQLLAETRAHAGMAFWKAGEQALANLAQLSDLARRYEANGGRSFRGFVELLARQAERGEVPEAPIVEEASEGVRMMTVHGAKGLEFPIVILADPTCPMTHKEPSQWVEPDKKLWAEPLAQCAPLELRARRDDALNRDREEGVRLTYVAVTRARDLLVVPAVGDAPLKGRDDEPTWLDPLYPVLYPAEDGKRAAAPAPGCPPFGVESVLERPDKARWAVSVHPGLHRSRDGQHEVVWWDPAVLPAEPVATGGLKGDEVLRDGPEAASTLLAYETWRKRRSQLLENGRRPTLRVVPAHDAGLAPMDVRTEATDVQRDGRPRGLRFGALVHAVLAEIPLTGGDVARTAAALARRLGSTPDEERAAIKAVEAALRHPLMGRAAAAAAVRRECPLMLQLPDGRLAEGVADLAFREGEQWTVVDFKTDFELDERRAQHEQQLTVYVQAIAAATGSSAVGFLLSV